MSTSESTSHITILLQRRRKIGRYRVKEAVPDAFERTNSSNTTHLFHLLDIFSVDARCKKIHREEKKRKLQIRNYQRAFNLLYALADDIGKIIAKRRHLNGYPESTWTKDQQKLQKEREGETKRGFGAHEEALTVLRPMWKGGCLQCLRPRRTKWKKTHLHR